MLKPFKAATFAIASIIMVGALTIVPAASAFATTNPSQPDPTVVPLEIVPVCSDATTASSVWTVTNKNQSPVSLAWDNFENARSGAFEAVAGQSTLTTYFNATDPNNTTRFTYSGNVSQTNAQVAPCAPVVITPTPEPEPQPVECIDGTDAKNLEVTWLYDNVVTVSTIGGLPLCEDVTVVYSSYIMPDNYDGTGFFNGNGSVANPTAYPQYIFSSVSIALEKGTDGLSFLLVGLPDECKNVQVDLYYAPVIEVVGENGHGTQNIASKIYPSTGPCEEVPTPTDPTTPVEPTPTHPPVVTPPVVETPAPAPVTPQAAAPVAPVATTTPAELPYTGTPAANVYVTILMALTLGALAYALTYRFQPNRFES